MELAALLRLLAALGPKVALEAAISIVPWSAVNYLRVEIINLKAVLRGCSPKWTSRCLFLTPTFIINGLARGTSSYTTR